jgi:hypothetical protein
MNLEGTLKFGKYKGQQVEDVVEDDPGYIRWLVENTDTHFDDEVLETLSKREARRS